MHYLCWINDVNPLPMWLCWGSNVTFKRKCRNVWIGSRDRWMTGRDQRRGCTITTAAVVWIIIIILDSDVWSIPAVAAWGEQKTARRKDQYYWMIPESKSGVEMMKKKKKTERGWKINKYQRTIQVWAEQPWEKRSEKNEAFKTNGLAVCFQRQSKSFLLLMHHILLQL